LALPPSKRPILPPGPAHAASLARRRGKHWRLVDEAAGTAASEQFSRRGELEGALASGQIVAFDQPKRNLATGVIDSAEALLRWHHPERGLLPPDCSVPLFEEAGRIDELTLAVLRRTLIDMRGGLAQSLAIGVAVNVSAALPASRGFAERARALVEVSGVPTVLLTFEVTESAELADAEAAIATLERFRARGIRIAMDDHGTGQSTPNYLKTLPLSELKIDRMFVASAHLDRGDGCWCGPRLIWRTSLASRWWPRGWRMPPAELVALVTARGDAAQSAALPIAAAA
jgi:EAL domain-containing protein (putative c-di-GMP-specific phosphodiesterase class I)